MLRERLVDAVLQILELLDREVPSGNPIFMIKTEQKQLIGGNEKANQLFSTEKNVFDLEKLFEESFSALLTEAISQLKEGQTVFTAEDLSLKNVHGEKMCVHLEFTYATNDGAGIILIMKIQEDRRPHYIEMLLKKNKHPAFMVEYGENLMIRQGNDAFYHAFICTEENIEEKYQNRFENFLPEDERDEYVSDIFQALSKLESGIVDIPIQTAHRDNLFFYFSKNILKNLLEEGEKCIFCLLVEQDEKIEDIEYPYDKPVC